MKIRTLVDSPDPDPDGRIRALVRTARLGWIADVVSGWRARRADKVNRELQLMSVGRTAVDLTNRPPAVFMAPPMQLARAIRGHLEKQGV